MLLTSVPSSCSLFFSVHFENSIESETEQEALMEDQSDVFVVGEDESGMAVYRCLLMTDGEVGEEEERMSMESGM